MLVYIKDKHLPTKECDNLIEFYKKNSDKAVLFRDVFPLKLEGKILKKTKKFLEPISVYLNNSVVEWSEIVRWPKQSYQNFHLDTARNTTILTSITYLNNDFIGGITYFADGTQFAPCKGRTVFFDGQYFTHSVSPVIQGERYVIATWYKKNIK